MLVKGATSDGKIGIIKSSFNVIIHNVTFFFVVYVWCDEIRDIRLWPPDHYSPNYTESFRNAFLDYRDDICIDIKQHLVNSSFIFSFKLRYQLELPQLRLLGGDEHMVCARHACFNYPFPILMVHSPAHIEPDDRNLFYPGSAACPYVRTVPWATRNMTRCHFLCSCDQWVDTDGFCDSQFVVIISSTAIPSSENDVKMCGLLERTLALPWVTLGTTRNWWWILRLLDICVKPILRQWIFFIEFSIIFILFHSWEFGAWHENVSRTSGTF